MNLTPEEAEALDDWITARAQYIAADLIYDTTPANSEHDSELLELKSEARIKAHTVRAQLMAPSASSHDPRAIPFKDLPVGATFWELDNDGQALTTGDLYTKVRDQEAHGLLINADHVYGQNHRLIHWDVWTLIVPAHLPSPTHPHEYGGYS